MRLLFDILSTLSDCFEAESENFLIYSYNAGPPTAIPIIHSTTVLHDMWLSLFTVVVGMMLNYHRESDMLLLRP